MKLFNTQEAETADVIVPASWRGKGQGSAKGINDLPEYDRGMVQMDSLDNAMSAVRHQAILDFDVSIDSRISYLEGEIKSLEGERSDLRERVREAEKDLRTTPRYISGKSLGDQAHE